MSIYLHIIFLYSFLTFIKFFTIIILKIKLEVINIIYCNTIYIISYHRIFNMSLKIFIVALLVVSSVFGIDNGLGLTPPMGWNSWNHFGCKIN